MGPQESCGLREGVGGPVQKDFLRRYGTSVERSLAPLPGHAHWPHRYPGRQWQLATKRLGRSPKDWRARTQVTRPVTSQTRCTCTLATQVPRPGSTIWLRDAIRAFLSVTSAVAWPRIRLTSTTGFTTRTSTPVPRCAPWSTTTVAPSLSIESDAEGRGDTKFL